MSFHKIFEKLKCKYEKLYNGKHVLSRGIFNILFYVIRLKMQCNNHDHCCEIIKRFIYYIAV